MITIVEATTRGQMKEFVKFPFSLYKDNKFWVPPIINDELESFDRTKNPAFEHADAYFYLAYLEGKIVGRIAAIVNWQEIRQQQKSKVRFGWFDFIDNLEVSKALLAKVYELGKAHALEYAEGPMGFSNLDKVGVLTEGFDQQGTMITWYNHAYYMDHFEKMGFVTEKQYIESRFPFANVKPEFFKKAQQLIKQRYGLKAISFTSTKDVMPYVDKMFDLFNESYEKLSSFVAISDVQKEYFKKKYISLINPEYIKMVEDSQGNLVAFAIVMPDFSYALQKANGKLFPFGFYHLLRARNHSKEVVFYLIGVHPEYQNKGVTAIIFDEYYETFTQKGIKYCIRTPELLENNAIHLLWKNFDPVIHCRRKTYRIELKDV